MQAHDTDTIDHQGDFSAVIALFRYGRGTYGQLLGGISLVIISSGILMFSAKLMGRLAELLINASPSIDIWTTVGGILTLEVIHIGVYYRGRVSIAYATNQVALSIRKALFAKLTQLPLSYYDRQPLGRTITRLTADVEGIESFFNNTMPRVLTATITVVSVLVAMLLTDFHMGFYITLSSLPALVFTVIMRKPVRYWVRDYKKKSAALNSKLAEFISGLPLIRVFGLEKWSAKSFEDSSKELLSSAFRLMNWNSFIRPLAAFLCSLPIVVILLWGGHMVLDKTITIGLLVAFIRYAERYFRPIMQLSFELHLIQDAIASSERVRKVLNEEEEDQILGKNGDIRQEIRGKVEFRKVYMSYDKQTTILKGIDLIAEAGMSMGLVGRTGSGKTTTVHLIPQLYPWPDGEILIDDIPIRRWDRKHLRENIGIVSQDVVIFQGTLRENLLMTAPLGRSISDHELLSACERTGLGQILRKLPGGLDATIQDSGTNLSMGERQLLAFTRMLLRSPAILILDEATANIDEPCEVLIQKAILELLKDRTCFIIAHRLSTIQHCDRILVFENGQIVEQGPHAHLLKSQGLYSKLVKRQMAHAFI